MQQFHFKSILLGIGIGIILASLLSMIYVAGMTPHMSREEIMEKAKEYGMVEKTNTFEQETTEALPQSSTDGTESMKETDETVPENTPMPQETPVEVRITIQSGDTSGKVGDKLLAAGLIEKVEDFENQINDRKLASSIKIGEYAILKGTDIPEIIRMITGSGKE